MKTLKLSKTPFLLSGWWFFSPPRKILVSWDHYSQYMEKKKNNPPISFSISLRSFSIGINASNRPQGSRFWHLEAQVSSFLELLVAPKH